LTRFVPGQQQQQRIRQDQLPELLRLANDPDDDEKPIPIEKAIRFTLRGDDLSVATDFKLEDGPRQVKLIGLEGSTRVEVGRRRGPLWLVPTFELRHTGAAGDDGGASQTRVYSQSSYIRIEQTIAIGDRRTSVLLTQDSGLFRRNRWATPDPPGERVTLRVTPPQTGPRPPDEIRISAGNFAELLRKDPARAERHLAPMFRQFGQDVALFRIDAQIGWQLFPDAAEVDPKTESRVLNLLAKLNVGDYRERELATAELEVLGGPAAQVLSEADRSALTPEQNTRVNAILSRYEQLDESEVARLVDDPAFLIRCFTYGDVPAVRAAAARAIARKLGDGVKLDPAAKIGDRGKAADKLLEILSDSQ
jgi:hypothetical protein